MFLLTHHIAYAKLAGTVCGRDLLRDGDIRPNRLWDNPPDRGRISRGGRVLEEQGGEEAHVRHRRPLPATLTLFHRALLKKCYLHLLR